MSETKRCPVHGENMFEKDGKFGPFFSHRTPDKTYASGWCNGKPPKGSETPSNDPSPLEGVQPNLPPKPQEDADLSEILTVLEEIKASQVRIVKGLKMVWDQVKPEEKKE